MFKKVLIASVALVAAVGAQAQVQSQSQSFSMSGTIYPGSCALTLGGSTAGAADFGTVEATAARATLQATTNHYDLGTKTFTWNVLCTSVTPLQLAFSDLKSGKVAAYDASTESQRFGLVDGSGGTAAIGSYKMTMDTSTTSVDGAAPKGFLSAANGLASWSNTYGATVVPGRAIGFQTTSTTQLTPSTLTKADGTLSVNVFLSKSYVDVAIKDIVINGGGTITLQYL